MDGELHAKVTAWRRHLHAHPELSLQEPAPPRSSARRCAISASRSCAGVGGHGVVATISRGQSNRSVGLRADMDALPITETTGLPYASEHAGRHARLRP